MDRPTPHVPPPGPAGTTYLERPEGRIAYDVAGEGPLVVCLPGMGELRSTYRHTAPALVQAGFRVATMDLRGHGDSDATFSSYDGVAAGGDALALVEHLGQPAVLVGNSMGAAAAAWAAAERPDLVDGLVLIGPFVRDVPMNPLVGLTFRLAMSGPWARRVWVSYLPKLSPGTRQDDYEDHREAISASLARPGRAAAFTATTRSSHAPVDARLGDVRAPTLVVMGTLDPDFPDPAAEAQHVADRLGGDVLLVEGAGHYPHADDPEAVNPALLSFLAEATGVHRGSGGGHE
jgi:pimeloyl-ACP methyl ester carboxylesterase